MKFLDRVPEDLREDVKILVLDDALEPWEKGDVLADLIADISLLGEIIDHLEEGSTEKLPIELVAGDASLEIGDVSTDAIEIGPDFFKEIPDCANILILGQTGVGKSTFVNGLVNYLKYGSIGDALKGGVEILIKTYFTHTDDNFKQLRVECEPTICIESGNDDDEHTVDGLSSTQAAKPYVFSIGPKGSEKWIRIIDTPGVGDVRGVEKERENIANVMWVIADLGEIHAVCILLKPNESKLSLTFRHCINEILTQLPVSVVENTFFCFTNTRQTFYRPGDTFATLEALLRELERKRGVKISLGKENMFCFDNESFRFLCALREGATFTPAEKENFNGSWRNTCLETVRMFRRLGGLTAQRVEDTLCLSNVRSVLLALSRPMAETSKNITICGKLIADKQKEIADCKKRGAGLKARLYVNEETFVRTSLSRPTTVCTSKTCVEHKRLSKERNAPMEVIYKTECHLNCCCPVAGVEMCVCPSPGLFQCQVLRSERCRVCGCLWNTHMHVNYRIDKRVEKKADPVVQKSIEHRDEQLDLMKYFIERETKTKQQYEQELAKMAACCADFTAYLKKNAVLPFNDVYKEYVEQLIQEEKDRVGQGASDATLLKLQKIKDEFEQMVKMFEKSAGGVKTKEEIYKLIEEMKETGNCGKAVKEIQKLKLLSVGDEKPDEIPVDLSKGWIAKAAV